jgi:hypothetical protein
MLIGKVAQQRVHWTGGILAANLRFFCPENLPYNELCPRPTHQQVTQPLGIKMPL